MALANILHHPNPDTFLSHDYHIHHRKLLRAQGLVETIEAENRAAHPDLRNRVSGKTVAVDLSIWIFEATTQPATADLFTPSGQVAKVVFERAVNYLRHGVTPVGVLDGTPPPEKLKHFGAGSGAFRTLGEVAKNVLNDLGLAVVVAPSEAEATCAALNFLGLVDGCATGDGDALAFGAPVVFKTLRLYADTPELSKIETCEARWIGEFLQLPGYAENSTDNSDNRNNMDSSASQQPINPKPGQVGDALIALATLTGGDYDVGAMRVGAGLAAKVVRRLAKEAEDEAGGVVQDVKAERRGISGGGGGGDVHVKGDDDGRIRLTESGYDRRNRPTTTETSMTMCDRLDQFLRKPPDPELNNLTQCTGCATCKHDGGGGSKKKKCVKGCVECGTASGQPCIFRDVQCQCQFHVRTLDRWADKARRRALETENFTGASRRAAAAYASQSQIALDFVKNRVEGKVDFTWHSRPNVGALSRVFAKHCELPRRRTREKLLPLLLEWDIAHETEDTQREFRVVCVKKHAGAKGMEPWRFLLEVDAVDAGERTVMVLAKEEVKQKKKLAKGKSKQVDVGDDIDSVPSQASGNATSEETSAEFAHFSQTTRDLLFFAGKPCIRSVRVELVREHLPQLLDRFERPSDNSAKTPKKDREKKTGASSARATPRGVPKERGEDQRSILGYVTPRKPGSPSVVAPDTTVSQAPNFPFATPAASLGVGTGTSVSPVQVNTGSSSELEASGIPSTGRTARRRILDDTHFGVHLGDGTKVASVTIARASVPVANSSYAPVASPARPAASPGTAFHSIGVGVVDLTTPSPLKRTPDPQRVEDYNQPASPLTSPTKKARQAGIKAFLTPSKKPTVDGDQSMGRDQGTSGIPEVVDLVDSDDSP